jgi:ribonuclease T2
MRARRLGLAAALGLGLAANAGAAQADNWWRELLLGPSAPRPASPCVLDKCLNSAAENAPAPSEPSAPPAPSSTPTAPGHFDFYVFALSWSPGFCDTIGAGKSFAQCDPGAKLGFVVHGLWPQFTRGYPSDCDPSRPVSRIVLQQFSGLYPDDGLARHEWTKHGTCTDLSPQAYFATVKRARDTIVIPDAFQAPSEEQKLAPIDIARAFLEANPDLRLQAMAVGCTQGELEDVRVCLAKDLRTFVDCPEVARSTCRAPTISVAPEL